MPSVIICTHNPKKEILDRVLDALKKQTLDARLWELILVDNFSDAPLKAVMDLSWHPLAQVIVEGKLGLAYARLAGVREAKNELLVFVDDDNVLDKNYLKEAINFNQGHPEVGCFGGKSIPEFQSEPPAWFSETGINLGCQGFEEQVYVSNYKSKNFRVLEYPIKAPIGTGMIIVKKAFLSYLKEVEKSEKRMLLGRKGNLLTSGEDNDIVLTLIKAGYEIAYVPQLVITHLIPKNRYSLVYLKKMAYESNRSWVKVLDLHGINPWLKVNKSTLFLRQIKAYLKHQPWKSELNAIAYHAALGIYRGQSEI